MSYLLLILALLKQLRMYIPLVAGYRPMPKNVQEILFAAHFGLMKIMEITPGLGHQKERA